MLKVTDKKNGTVPEGYQLTSIGIIPLDWDLKPLGMIADEITQTTGTAMYETVSISAGIGFVNQAKKFGKELSGKQYEKYIVLHKGDFSYNKGNSQKYPQGCIYRLTDRETAAVPNVFESFRIKDGVVDYFEQLFISGFLNRQLFAKINHGVRDNGLLNLTGEDFYSCKVPFPPVKEQKKIAEILIQYDKIIELCKCKLEKVIKLKKACMGKMFPEQGKTIPEIRFPGFSDSWEQHKLGELGTVQTCKRIFKEQTSEYGDIPFFKNGTIGLEPDSYISREVYEEFRRLYPYPEPGDTLISVVGSIGRTAEYTGKDEYFQDSNVVWLKTEGSINKKFLKISYQVIKWLIEGSTVKHLYNDNILRSEIVMPPSQKEQAKIAAYFEMFDHLITLHQHELEEMEKMKKVLMQQLLTGKVRVKI